MAALLRVVRGCDPRSDRLAPGAQGRTDGRDGPVPSERDQETVGFNLATRPLGARHVTVDGDQLSDDELSMFLVQLLVAGNETTRNMLSAGLVALADAPDQRRRRARTTAF